MKRYCLVAFIMLAGVIMALADEIYLTGGTVVRWKVVCVTDTEEWYLPETKAEEGVAPGTFLLDFKYQKKTVIWSFGQ